MTGPPGTAAGGERAGVGPGSVTLRIRDSEAQLAFYTELLGLTAREEGTVTGAAGAAGTSGGGEARRRWRLGAADGEPPLLILEHTPEAPRRPPGSAGLFHVALLVPSREALARVLLRLRQAGPSLAGGSFQGASDHGVSRALYLADPEGNGLEIYHDRPRAAWPSKGRRIDMFTRPLDLEGLLRGVDEEAPLPSGTAVGHVHLQTSDLEEAEAFWVGRTGMDPTVRTYPGALFLAHGDYHHHLGLNVWGGPLVPASGNTLGLARLEWRVPVGEGEPRRLRSPDGFEVTFRAR